MPRAGTSPECTARARFPDIRQVFDLADIWHSSLPTIVFPLMIVWLRPHRYGLPAGSLAQRTRSSGRCSPRSRSSWSAELFAPHVPASHHLSVRVSWHLRAPSVLWAFKPELSFIRFAQQVMIVTSVVLPALLVTRATDLMRGLFLCFAIAALLNLFFVFDEAPDRLQVRDLGLSRILLGQELSRTICGVALLLSLYEALNRGPRRVFGIVVAMISVALLILSNSKTSMGLALLAPILADSGVGRQADHRHLCSPSCCSPSRFATSCSATVTGFSVNRLSYMLYGDPTFTGRYDHLGFRALADRQRARLFGWGYQSFWLVGPDGPASSRRRAG